MQYYNIVAVVLFFVNFVFLPTALHRWGDHYWMVDFDMDCSLTEGGWFELKTFGTGGGNYSIQINTLISYFIIE